MIKNLKKIIFKKKISTLMTQYRYIQLVSGCFEHMNYS